MDKLTSKQVRDYCFNCGQKQDFTNTYNHGKKVETACNECGIADSFPIDDED